MAEHDVEARVRLDKWLWAARFFKTRSLAAVAVSGGKVQVNSQRAKPARAVREGDQLTIRRGQTEFQVDVIVLSDRRGPASQAQLLYAETEQSQKKRELEAEKQRQFAASHPLNRAARPNKKERRHIIRFRRQSDGDQESSD